VNGNRNPENRRISPNSFFFPLLLIAIGVIYLLHTFKVIQGDPGELFIIYWPVLFIVGGLDSLYRREGFANALVGIGIGSVLLLGNLGYLELKALPLLLRLWPFFLMGWGVDLALGRNRSWVSISAGIILGGALVVGMLWAAGLPGLRNLQTQQQNLSQALQGAQSADVSIEITAGTLQIEGGSTAANLVEIERNSTTSEPINVQYEVSQGLGTFQLVTSGTNSVPVFPFGNNSDLAWDLKFNSDIPLTLNSKLITGEQKVDLSQLDLNSFSIETIVGNAQIILPQGTLPDGEIQVTVGELVVMVPRGVPLQIELDRGLTSVSLPDGFTQNGNVITSPESGSVSDRIDLKVNLPLGVFVVEYSN
jgi:hypothetical protein